MLSKLMLDEMNEQIKHELYSSYLYLSMSAHCESANLPGFAAWLRVQAQEELGHALKFYDHILDRNEKVTLQAIDQPVIEFKSPKDVFQQVYEHEQKVTARIHKLYSLAVDEKDYASQTFLLWFVNEQVEEEKNSSQILDMLEKIGTSVGSLYQLDHRVGERGKGE